MKIYIAMAAALVLGSAAALAADSATDQSATTAPTGHKHWAECAGDIQKFCGNIEHGKGKMRACLTEHTADLSDACKQRMAQHASKDAAPAN